MNIEIFCVITTGAIHFVSLSEATAKQWIAEQTDEPYGAYEICPATINL